MRRGLALYLVVTFGVAWALWGLVALRGGLTAPQAGVLVVTSMFAPTLGTLAAWRWADPAALAVTGVRRHGPWRWYLVAYLLVPTLLLLGAALAMLVGIQQPDPEFRVLQELIRQQTERSGVGSRHR